MPLSEHEQRLLEQMERALYAEDPKFATALRGSDLRGRYRRRAAYGALGFLAGLAMLPVGIARAQIVISVVGFVVMLGSAIWAITNWRRTPQPGDLGIATASGRPAPRGKAAKQPRTGLMDRAEERWRRRREQDGS